MNKMNLNRGESVQVVTADETTRQMLASVVEQNKAIVAMNAKVIDYLAFPRHLIITTDKP